MLVGVHPEERSHLAAMLRAVRDAPPNTPPALAHLRALRRAPLSAGENLAWVWAEIKLSSDGARLAGTAKSSRHQALKNPTWGAARGSFGADCGATWRDTGQFVYLVAREVTAEKKREEMLRCFLLSTRCACCMRMLHTCCKCVHV